ncbi:tryptophan halogenase family protein [Erythrobacter alti]|uniref:tryptophan halogenase family protein n=1 Tax=Erythrobacter alti TaxID=1896145 RepID=UPI0030F4AE80
MTEPTPPHMVILGGGSAGWITACLLHHRWADRGGKVTVIESPDIGIIGVGEGSTPQMKAMFDHLGIAEVEWMAACDATYKLGIRFTGWSERPDFDSYFHPFPGPVDLHTEPAFTHACMLARRGLDVGALPDDWFLAAVLAEQGKGPQAAETFPFAPSYGYHFDAYKLGAFLRDWAVERGVDHRPLKVEEVELSDNREVSALVCEGGERISGDFYVDCSGFRAMIAQGALGGEFVSFGENLFNDRAVVVPTPPVDHFRPQTEAVAMKAGWQWHIPLTSRTGNGYVYSSRHISDEDAAAELLKALGLQADETEPRLLRMKVGRMAESWRGNCLAAGLAQGFLEPLEATALHIVISTALEFADAYEQGGYSAQHRDAFNTKTNARYEGIRDYIVAHYRMNQRSDTDYWRENAANHDLSDNLKAMMTAWFTHKDIAAANVQLYGTPHYAPMSWHALFAGYGTFPPVEKMQPLPPGGAGHDPERIRQLLASCAANFPEITLGSG